MRKPGRSPRYALFALASALALAGCTILPAADERFGPAGALAGAFLRPEPYTRVRIELHAEPGADLDRSGVEDARAVLAEAIGKPVDVTRATGIKGKGAGAKYTLDDIVALEEAHREGSWADGSTIVVHALVLAGTYETDPVLAIAYRASSLAFFTGKIDGISAENGCSVMILNPCGNPEARYLVRSVFVHEVGHLLGLVNTGAPMQKAREDPESPGHSTNRESVMYKGVERFEDFGRYLYSGDKIPYQFDPDDLADLRALAQAPR